MGSLQEGSSDPNRKAFSYRIFQMLSIAFLLFPLYSLALFLPYGIYSELVLEIFDFSIAILLSIMIIYTCEQFINNTLPFWAKWFYPPMSLQTLHNRFQKYLIAVFLAAYMSTIASQLNWGTSYLVNDVYRRFIKSDKDEKHYVAMSRLSMLLLTLFSLLITQRF